MAAHPARPIARPAADLSTSILTSLACWIADLHGEAALEAAAASAGLDGRRIMRREWISIEQFEAFLAAGRRLASSDEEFKQACAYRAREVDPAMRILLSAVSPLFAYELGARAIGLIASISWFRVRREGQNVTVLYRSTRPESRLMCLTRQGQMEAVPRLWGLPPAEVGERSCIANGDWACEYRVRVPVWTQRIPGSSEPASRRPTYADDPSRFVDGNETGKRRKV
jgi:hypothetical protein